MTTETLTPRKTIDKGLFLIVLTLMLFGIVMVYSASNVIAEQKFGSSTHFLVNQFLRAMMGIVILMFAAKYDYHNYKRHTMMMLLIAGVLCAVVLTLGQLKGAARWLQVGGFGIQPSEIAKIALVFYVAGYMDSKGDRIRDFQNGLLPPLIMAGVFAVAIILQPNFSTAAVVMGMVILMLFIGGMDIKHLGMMAAVAIPVALLTVILSPYRRARLMAFLDPTADMQGSGYQIKQSLISFANGGLTGVGVGQGQQKLLFLPEPFTDFIYSIIGEEMGFIGAVLVLGLFIVFLFRAIKTARTAPDMYGFYLATGIIISIVVYALVNAGVAVGVFPTTGLPMPFISYGGTSLLFTCFLVGVLLNISSQTVSKDEAMKATAPEYAMRSRFTENFNVGGEIGEEEEYPTDTTPLPTKKAPAKKAVRTNIVGMDMS